MVDKEAFDLAVKYGMHGSSAYNWLIVHSCKFSNTSFCSLLNNLLTVISSET